MPFLYSIKRVGIQQPLMMFVLVRDIAEIHPSHAFHVTCMSYAPSGGILDLDVLSSTDESMICTARRSHHLGIEVQGLLHSA